MNNIKGTNKKRILIMLLALTIIIALSIKLISNSKRNNNPVKSDNSLSMTTDNQSKFPYAEQEKKPLILYFSRAENIKDAEAYLKTLGDDKDAMSSASILKTDDGEITGNIGLLAREIADVTGGKLFSIKVKEQYPQLKKDIQKLVLQEQLDGVFPDVQDSNESFDEYDTVYLGFPNWYAEPPRALYKFLEKYDFNGKTIIPFTSDDKNRFSDSVDILKSKLPDSKVLSAKDGLLVNRKDIFTSKEKVNNWV